MSRGLSWKLDFLIHLLVVYMESSWYSRHLNPLHSPWALHVGTMSDRTSHSPVPCWEGRPVSSLVIPWPSHSTLFLTASHLSLSFGTLVAWQFLEPFSELSVTLAVGSHSITFSVSLFQPALECNCLLTCLPSALHCEGIRAVLDKYCAVQNQSAIEFGDFIPV